MSYEIPAPCCTDTSAHPRHPVSDGAWCAGYVLPSETTEYGPAALKPTWTIYAPRPSRPR